MTGGPDWVTLADEFTMPTDPNQDTGLLTIMSAIVLGLISMMISILVF